MRRGGRRARTGWCGARPTAARASPGRWAAWDTARRRRGSATSRWGCADARAAGRRRVRAGRRRRAGAVGRRRRRGAVPARMGWADEVRQERDPPEHGPGGHRPAGPRGVEGRVGVAATNECTPEGARKRRRRAPRRWPRSWGPIRCGRAWRRSRRRPAGRPVLRRHGRRLARDARRSRRRPDRHVRTRVHGRRRLRDHGDGGGARQHRGPAMLGALHAGLGHHRDLGLRGRQRLRRDVLRVGRDDRRGARSGGAPTTRRWASRSPKEPPMRASTPWCWSRRRWPRSSDSWPAWGSAARATWRTGPASAARRTSRWRRPRSRSGTTAPTRARWERRSTSKVCRSGGST